MTLIFKFKTEEEAKELYDILNAVGKKHFIESFKIEPYERPIESLDFMMKQVGYSVYIPNCSFFEDIEKMKESVREQSRKGAEEILFHDFYEEVVENLSFVPGLVVYGV